MEYRPVWPVPDVDIVGAGVIGLSLALELRRRGLTVRVLERSRPLRGASHAAAGMLAVDDPYNPAPLQPLARFSANLYPEFLLQLSSLSGMDVPYQTDSTWQWRGPATPYLLKEHSLDPRQLSVALLSAATHAGVLIEHPRDPAAHLAPSTAANRAPVVVYATGAFPLEDIPVVPRKGQMLRVTLPAGRNLSSVHRAEHIYVVPRTHGPQAGTALIGATVEDAGFDLSVDPTALQALRQHAAALVPELADERHAPAVESWAGLRPGTPDGLPILGELPSTAGRRRFVATGHFRNGILLAPGTAAVMADLVQQRQSPVDLQPFAAARFAPAAAQT